MCVCVCRLSCVWKTNRIYNASNSSIVEGARRESGFVCLWETQIHSIWNDFDSLFCGMKTDVGILIPASFGSLAYDLKISIANRKTRMSSSSSSLLGTCVPICWHWIPNSIIHLDLLGCSMCRRRICLVYPFYHAKAKMPGSKQQMPRSKNFLSTKKSIPTWRSFISCASIILLNILANSYVAFVELIMQLWINVVSRRCRTFK